MSDAVIQKPDLNWARQHLGKFASYKDMVDRVKEDQERYRQHPGYVPKFKVQE